jgi:hypothetical protein
VAIAKIKTEEERARLDAIFAEIEAAERGELFEPEPQQDPQKSPTELRLENRPINEIVGDARSMMGCGGLHTRWERIFAKALVALYDDKPKEQGAINAELNILRNFVQAVSTRLEKAEKAAREQDNHHYYKIFADGVKKLLDSI